MMKRRARTVESLLFQPVQDRSELLHAADALAAVTRESSADLFAAMRAFPRRWAMLVSAAAASTPFVAMDLVAEAEAHLARELFLGESVDDLRYPPAAFAAAFELGRAMERQSFRRTRKEVR